MGCNSSQPTQPIQLDRSKSQIPTRNNNPLYQKLVAQDPIKYQVSYSVPITKRIVYRLSPVKLIIPKRPSTLKRRKRPYQPQSEAVSEFNIENYHNFTNREIYTPQNKYTESHKQPTSVTAIIGNHQEIQRKCSRMLQEIGQIQNQIYSNFMTQSLYSSADLEFSKSTQNQQYSQKENQMNFINKQEISRESPKKQEVMKKKSKKIEQPTQQRNEYIKVQETFEQNFKELSQEKRRRKKQSCIQGKKVEQFMAPQSKQSEGETQFNFPALQDEMQKDEQQYEESIMESPRLMDETPENIKFSLLSKIKSMKLDSSQKVQLDQEAQQEEKNNQFIDYQITFGSNNNNNMIESQIKQQRVKSFESFYHEHQNDNIEQIEKQIQDAIQFVQSIQTLKNQFKSSLKSIQKYMTSEKKHEQSVDSIASVSSFNGRTKVQKYLIYFVQPNTISQSISRKSSNLQMEIYATNIKMQLTQVDQLRLQILRKIDDHYSNKEGNAQEVQGQIIQIREEINEICDQVQRQLAPFESELICRNQQFGSNLKISQMEDSLVVEFEEREWEFESQKQNQSFHL